MKEQLFRRLGQAVLLIGTLAAVCSCAGKSPVTKIDPDTFLADIEKKAYLIQQFRTEFVKTRRSTVFKNKVTVHARLVFQKPSSFMLIMTGDVNAEVFSDGRFVTLVHDGNVEETHQITGDRDVARFADPLMLLIDQIGTGALRRFRTVRQEQQGDSIIMEVEPSNNGNQFERIRSATIRFSVLGDIRSVDIKFINGDEDLTVFENWALIAEDDPDLLRLKDKLKRTAEKHGSPSLTTIPGPDSPTVSDGHLMTPPNSL